MKYMIRVIIFILILFNSCNNKKKTDYNKSLLLGEGEYKEYNEEGLILRDGYFIDGKFSGSKYEYSGDSIVAIHLYEYGQYMNYYISENGTFNKWEVQFSDEEMMIDINNDTLKIGDTLKVKFLVNYQVVDTLVLKINDKLCFKYPTSNRVKYIFKKRAENIGINNLDINAILFSINNKKDTLNYKLPYFVLEK